MTRIALRLYVDPGEAEITFNVRLRDQSFQRMTGSVDTGAAITLLPDYLLTQVDHRVNSRNGSITIEQAGIAKQSFQAVEAFITLFLEDGNGNRTQPFEVPAWFAQTDIALIGFAGILDQSILHINMLKREGWLEIDK